MSNEKAKPGDTVEIISSDSIHKGNKYFVIECPERFEITSLRNETWVTMVNGQETHFPNEWCKIVKQSHVVKEASKCKECRGTGKIALLTSVVDCDCITKT